MHQQKSEHPTCSGACVTRVNVRARVISFEQCIIRGWARKSKLLGTVQCILTVIFGLLLTRARTQRPKAWRMWEKKNVKNAWKGFEVFNEIFNDHRGAENKIQILPILYWKLQLRGTFLFFERKKSAKRPLWATLFGAPSKFKRKVKKRAYMEECRDNLL